MKSLKVVLPPLLERLGLNQLFELLKIENRGGKTPFHSNCLLKVILPILLERFSSDQILRSLEVHGYGEIVLRKVHLNLDLSRIRNQEIFDHLMTRSRTCEEFIYRGKPFSNSWHMNLLALSISIDQISTNQGSLRNALRDMNSGLLQSLIELFIFQ